MTDPEIRQWLRDNGYPEHVWKGGRPGLIDAWKEFVEEAESGYELGLEDYCNDLDTRALIARLGLDDAVAADDARFKALLTETGTRVWTTDPDGFWNFGYPANASGDFRDDLSTERPTGS